MKTLAATAIALMALCAVGASAHAESTYWQDRSEGRGYVDSDAYPSRGAGDHVDIRMTKRVRGSGAAPFAPRSYNGPVYQSQEEVQQSVYDFATGGFGNIKSYR